MYTYNSNNDNNDNSTTTNNANTNISQFLLELVGAVLARLVLC